MDLQRLERFVVLAKERNYTRAAEQLNIPQSHLSKQIKQLEKELGVELFNRTRPLELTASGTVFLEKIERILAEVKQAKVSAQRASRGEIGRLTVGINTSISNSLLPDILQVFRRQFPDVELVLQELLVKESHQKLQESEIDVDFENVYNLQDIDDQHILMYEVIRQEPLVMVLPETHRLTHLSQVRLKDLDEEPFVLPSRDLVPGLHNIIRSVCEQAGVRLKVAQEATWMSTVLSLIAGGVGVSLLPANAMNLRRTGVVYREIQGQSPVFQMAIVWRRDNAMETLHNFLEVVRSVSRRSQA
jgi:DNA-binding transcriptional LysR family regulator